MAVAVRLECIRHGPMQYRPPLGWWECVGFDGEGCSVQLVYDEDIAGGDAPPGTRLAQVTQTPASDATC